MLKIDIITIFPRLFDSFLKESIIKNAQKKELIEVKIFNLRDFAKDKHKTVDDRPYGGGLGMVLKIEPIFKALQTITKYKIEKGKFKIREKGAKIILFSPRGRQFNQKIAHSLSKLKRIIIICGRYEGIDERVAKYIADYSFSIGPYDLMGGELPAMILIEAVARLIPGVLGKKELLKERVTKEGGFIEYAQYTRPEIFKPTRGIKWRVPKVLLSGNHKKIQDWREKNKKEIVK